MPKASVVIPYYNRLEHLYFTLRTFENWNTKEDVEIIIVNDASNDDKNPSLIIDKFNLNINLIEIKKEEKKWINPCHCFNIGFKEAKGEIIIIQSPECFHLGPVIDTAVKHVTSDNYVLFPCKSVPADVTEKLWTVKDSTILQKELNRILQPIKQKTGCWYHHPKHNPTCYHFLSAINRKTLLDELGGFDERYARGCAFDDNEFITRIKRSPLEIIQLSSLDCIGVHQWHPKIHSGNCKDEVWQNNWRIFLGQTKQESTWKVNNETNS